MMHHLPAGSRLRGCERLLLAAEAPALLDGCVPDDYVCSYWWPHH